MLRVNSLVRLDTSRLTDLETMNYPAIFSDGTPVVFLGEIPNMQGHGIFVSKNHHFIGYKMSLFTEAPTMIQGRSPDEELLRAVG